MALDFRKWHANGMKRRPRRPWARWAMAGAIVVTLAAAAAHTVVQPDHLPTPVMVWLPLLVMMWSPFARDSWISDRGLASYDEFEQAGLLRATSRAYGVFLLLVLALLVWMWGAAMFGWPQPTTSRGWMAWGMALLATGTALPATFAEFMVPMPDLDDEPM